MVAARMGSVIKNPHRKRSVMGNDTVLTRARTRTGKKLSLLQSVLRTSSRSTGGVAECGSGPSLTARA
jgi:hypothetical protein